MDPPSAPAPSALAVAVVVGRCWGQPDANQPGAKPGAGLPHECPPQPCLSTGVRPAFPEPVLVVHKRCTHLTAPAALPPHTTLQKNLIRVWRRLKMKKHKIKKRQKANRWG